MGTRGLGLNPLWAKAPLLLFEFPALFLAVAAAALLLALAAASAPLFVSSAGSSALHDELEDATRFGAGVALRYYPSERLGAEGADPEQVQRLHAALRPSLGGVPYVAAPVFTVFGATVTPGTTPTPSSQRPLRLLAKTGALAHIEKLAGRDGDGFWIADEAAESMRLEPGDVLYLSGEGTTGPATVSIDGIYRALWKEPRTPYWRSLSHDIYERSDRLGAGGSASGPPPTFLVGDLAQVVELSRKLADQSLPLLWEWPLATTSLTVPDAERLERRFRTFQNEANELATRVRISPDCEGCPAFATPRIRFSSLLSTGLTEAKGTVSSLRGPADLLSTTGILVALAVVAAAGAFAMARRRVEVAVLFARGTGPLEVGSRVALETLLPVALGAAAGFGLAVALVGAIGPGSVDSDAVLDAGRAAALAVPAAFVLVGLVAAYVFFRTAANPRPRFPLVAALPWELPVLVGAAYLFYRLRRDGAFSEVPSGEIARVSFAVVAFPILFTAGCAGLAARGLRRPLLVLRGRGRSTSASVYLTVRRLASAERLALLLITASALALGMFVYAQTVVRSLEATVEAKSLLFVGSDVNARTDYGRELPKSFPFPATIVTKLVERGQLGSAPVDVMAVEPDTLAEAAYWDASWGERPFADIVRALEDPGGADLAVVVAGRAPAASAVEILGTSYPIEVIETVRAFPGMSIRRPLVVADGQALERLADAAEAPNPLVQIGAETQVWVKGETRRAAHALRSSELRPSLVTTAELIRDNPHIRSVTQTFSFLEALGLGAGLLAIAGTLLYLQARQRARVVSYALARRMGLAARSHRRALFLELAAMLVGAFAIGAVLAVVTARLVVVELDAPVRLPSGPLFRIPWWLVAGTPLALAVVSLLGALVVDRWTRRARIAEVLRAGE